MQYFVSEHSIVRKIWGKSDTIAFIFAGAAAEFALNKAVDWLYFTGKLPADPIGRLFSTVTYAQQIVFFDHQTAILAIDKINMIHGSVEASRQQRIPEWAYRDVLFMLIYYSIAAYELLERKLTDEEKEEVFDVFHRMAVQMKLSGLPSDFKEWEVMRQEHLEKNLHRGEFTIDLFKQYKKHLGPFNYQLLLQGQMLVVPPIVHPLLQFRKLSWLRALVPFYQFSRILKIDLLIKSLILPAKYKARFKALDK